MIELTGSLVGLGVIGGFLKNIVDFINASGDTHHAFSHLIEHLKERIRDPDNVPANHDLNHAVNESLLEAARAFALGVAAQLDPQPPIIDAIRKHLKEFKFSTPLLEMRKVPGRDWIAELLDEAEAKPNKRRHGIAADLNLKEDDITKLLIDSGPNEFQNRINENFKKWVTNRVQDAIKPDCVDGYLISGWPVEKNGAETITFYQAFCLFFREKIKTEPRVFNIFVAQTLSTVASDQKKLSGLPGEVAKVLTAVSEMKSPSPDDLRTWLADQYKDLEGWLEAKFEKVFFGQAETNNLIVESNKETIKEIKATINALGNVDGVGWNSSKHFDKVDRRFDSVVEKLDKLLEVRSTNTGPQTVSRTGIIATIDGETKPARELSDSEAQTKDEGAAKHHEIPNYDDIYESELIGRAKELKKLIQLITKSDCKQIALVGGPGLGKTHIACALMRSEAVKKHFVKCVFVDLRSQETVDAMCEKTAQTLGVHTEDKNNTAKIIGEYLGCQNGRLFIILDNLEQIAVSAAPVIGAWLKINRNVTFLATSRTHFHGKWQEMKIDPLPKISLEWKRSKILRSDSIKILLRQIKLKKSGFNVNEGDNLLQAANLCSELDYIPLAIVLAANLITHRSLKLLVDDISTTLRDANSKDKLFNFVGRSLNTLSEEARVLFLKTHVFEDGFTEEAAVAIFYGDSSLSKEEKELIVHDKLFEMLDKNLLTSLETDLPGKFRTRYRMFRIVHEFAKTLWNQKNSEDGISANAKLNADWNTYFFEYTSRWNNLIHGSECRQALEMLAIDQQNILKAVSFKLQSYDICGVDFYLNYSEFLAIRGPAQRREQMLELCLAKTQENPLKRLLLLRQFIRHCWSTSQYARAELACKEIHNFESFCHGNNNRAEAFAMSLLEVGYLTYHQKGGEDAKPIIAKCIELLKTIGYQRGLAAAEREMASILDDEGNCIEALQMFNPAVDYFEQNSDLIELAQTLNKRGVTHWHTGGWKPALNDFIRAEMVYSDLKSEMRLAGVYTNQALALTDAGRFDTAIELTKKAATLHIRAGNRAWQAVNLVSMARAMYYQNKDSPVMPILNEAIALSEKSDYKENIALGNLIMGQFLFSRGQLNEAITILEDVRESQRKLYKNGNHRVCYTLATIAQLHFEMGNLNGAQLMAEEAFTMARKFSIDESNPSQIIRNKYMALIQLRTKLGMDKIT